MSKVEVSIFCPAIRTNRWKAFYESAKLSCNRHSFEIVFISPFSLPDELVGEPSVRLIKSHRHPSACAQLAIEQLDGRLAYHVVDDALFTKGSISDCIDLYDKGCTFSDAINMRYTEGENYSGQTLPMEYWMAYYHGELRQPGVSPRWAISCHHMLSTSLLKELGGYDPVYEYINHGLHDLMFRLQANGGKLINSPMNVTNCDWMPGNKGDHKPIVDAQIGHDLPIFLATYKNPRAAYDRIKIPLDLWKQYPEVWERRFGKELPNDYTELLGRYKEYQND